MSIDFTPLAEAVILIICAIVSAYIIPWIKGRTNADQQANIAYWVEIAVYAAEKFYGSGEGKKKFEYATDFLKSKGIELDVQTLCMLIDAEIKKMEQFELYEVEEEAEVE